MKPTTLITALGICVFAVHTHAQDASFKGSTTTEVAAPIENAKGYALRPRLSDVLDNIKAKKFNEAQSSANALCLEYEALFDKNNTQYSFATRDDLVEFVRYENKPFEWIDWGYKECLHYKMFLAAERKDYSLALDISNQISKLVPISASSEIERGYILNGLRRFTEALVTYEHARDISVKYKSQAPFLPVALRGIGANLIDLNRWEEAEAVFEESLRVDPGNKVALNELEFIRQKRTKK